MSHRLSAKQSVALSHGALMFLAGLASVALTWFVGVASGHPLSIPVLLTALPALLVALAAYALHALQPDALVAPPAPVPTPITPPQPAPVTPPTPPTGG